MTQLYSWFPMPHKLDINCPVCGGHACFEFAESMLIKLKKDINFFRKSTLFEYRQQIYTGQKYHLAFYYALLHGGDTKAIHGLPDGYTSKDWQHSKYLTHSHANLGAFSCFECYTRAKHELDWDKDAFYKLTIRGDFLWAFNRQHALDIKKFIASNDRNEKLYHYGSTLRHLPTIFKLKNNRDDVVKKIDKLLMK